MNLFLDLLPLALVGLIFLGLAVGLICLVVGVHCIDRSGLDSLHGGLCAQLARRVIGLHVIGPYDKS